MLLRLHEEKSSVASTISRPLRKEREITHHLGKLALQAQLQAKLQAQLQENEGRDVSDQSAFSASTDDTLSVGGKSERVGGESSLGAENPSKADTQHRSLLSGPSRDRKQLRRK